MTPKQLAETTIASGDESPSTALENFKDALTEITRPIEAGKLFSRASLRVLEFLGGISAVRQTVEKAMPFGKDALDLENIETVLRLLSDPKSSKIFKNPKEMVEGKKYVGFAENLTDKLIANANSLVSAAALVFAHAVFDATLLDYCRVTALQSWRDWLDVVKQRKVSIADIDAATKLQTLLKSVDEHVEQLEKESMLKKADILFSIIKPGKDFRPVVRNYEYSRQKLQAIDDDRHGAVHRLEFRDGIADVDKTVDYLQRTALYFMQLLNFRYGLRIDLTVSTNGK